MENRQTKNENLGPVEGSLLGLLALLLAFTFNMASTRYDQRRQVIVEEANHIGTAVLRADLYPDSIRIPLRSDFKKYVESRITYYNAGIDDEKLNDALQQSEQISARIWKRVAEAAQDPKNLVRSAQMIPAMNNMIDVVTTRDTTKNATVPESILWLLLILVLSSSFIIGYDNEKKINKVLITGFATMISLTVFVILDLDKPRRGFINNNRAEQKIEALRSMFVENK
uniref:bestrophin-like domain n=1 Tax=Flavobacterium limnosediminis TaxID=1401027 RepID=UPI00138B10F9|nr:hypothetical protein [Flavobacterium limnosediminis]